MKRLPNPNPDPKPLYPTVVGAAKKCREALDTTNVYSSHFTAREIDGEVESWYYVSVIRLRGDT
jgi:hypothetical protein